MHNRHEILARFMPALLIRRANISHQPTEEAFAERWPAAIAHIRVDGFAAVAEQVTGDDEVAKLHQVLDAFYGHLLDLIFEAGGDVLRFGADAIVAMWQPAEEGEEGDALPTATLRAARTMLQLQREVPPREMGRGLHVGLRIGLGAGQVQVLHVGGNRDRWEPVLMGSPLEQAESAAAHAKLGQILLPREPWALIRFRSVGERAEGGFAELSAIKGTLPSIDNSYPLANDRSLAPMWGYAPGPVRAALTSSEGDTPFERRRVSVIHVRVNGLGPEAPLAEVQAAISALQEALYREHGSLLRIAFEDNNVSFLGAYGVHPSHNEDDPRRAVACALAMRRALMRQSLDARVGIATGTALCGSIGNNRRRTYTVTGLVLESAQALSGAAAEVLCDTPTWVESKESADFETLPPMDLQGRVAPVHRPQAMRRVVDPGRKPIVGRDAEVERVARAVEALTERGQGGLVVIEGAEGMGKTRLLREILDRAVAADLFPLSGAGEPLDRNQPFHAWRAIVAASVGIESLDSEGASPERVLGHLSSMPALREGAGLLSPLLGLSLPESERTASLQGPARAQATLDLLTSLLTHHTRGQATLITFDDAHWIDEESWSLLEKLQSSRTPVLFVVTLNPEVWAQAPAGRVQRRVLEAPNTQRVALGPLSDPHIARFAKNLLGANQLPDALAAVLADRAQGNVLFAEQLLVDLREGGLISAEGGAVKLADAFEAQRAALPKELTALVQRRLARLEPSVLATLQVASIIGRSFTFEQVHDVFPGEADMAQLADDLGVLAARDLTPLQRRDPVELYRFKHPVIQQVAYHGMPTEQRRAVHGALAKWYEEQGGADTTNGAAPRLAVHWREAGEHAKSQEYVNRAAAAALRGGAWEEARRVLNEALLAAPTDARGPALAAWERMAAEASIHLAQPKEARRHLERALERLRVGLPATSLGWWLERLSQRLIHRWRKVRAPAPQTPEQRQFLLESSRADALLSQLACARNDILHAEVTAFRAVNDALRVGPGPELARAWVQLAAVHDALGRHDAAAACTEASAQIAGKLSHGDDLHHLFDTLANRLLDAGEWERAGHFAVQARDHALIVGDRTTSLRARLLRAQSLALSGQLEDGVGAAERAWESAHEQRDTDLLLVAHALLAELNLRRGEHDLAHAYLEDIHSLIPQARSEVQVRLMAVRAALDHRGRQNEPARRGARELVNRLVKLPANGALLEAWRITLDVLLYAAERAEGEVRQHALDGVRPLVVALGPFAKRVIIAEPLRRLTLGRVAWLEDRADDAVREAEAAIEEAKELRMPVDEALASLELGRRLGFRDRVGREALQRAQQTFEGIGARWDRDQAYEIAERS